jgi:hypothetical protein
MKTNHHTRAKQIPFSGLPFTQSSLACGQNTALIPVTKSKSSSLEKSNNHSKESAEEFTTWLTCRHTNVDIKHQLCEASRTPVSRQHGNIHSD